MLILLGILAFIFNFQREFFSEELHDPYVGAGFLLIVLIFEFFSHIGYWKAKSRNEVTTKWLFLVFSIALMSFSAFVNLAVMIHRSEEEKLAKIIERDKVVQDNSIVEKKRRLIEKEIDRIEKLIASKDKSIKRTSKWTVEKIESQKDEWSLKLADLNKELIDLSTIKEKKVKSYSILENFERSTGVDAHSVSLANKGFFSIILSIIPFFTCYFVIEKGRMKREDFDKTEKQIYNFEAISKEENPLNPLYQGDLKDDEEVDEVIEKLEEDREIPPAPFGKGGVKESEIKEKEKEVLPAKRNSLIEGIGKMSLSGIII